MGTHRKKVLGRRAKAREKSFWLLMKSAESGISCYS
jgi:hypothetical protein